MHICMYIVCVCAHVRMCVHMYTHLSYVQLTVNTCVSKVIRLEKLEKILVGRTKNSLIMLRNCIEGNCRQSAKRYVAAPQTTCNVRNSEVTVDGSIVTSGGENDDVCFVQCVLGIRYSYLYSLYCHV